MSNVWGDRFYGRQKELNILLDKYKGLLNLDGGLSGGEIIVVAGDSGWGKTALIHEFYKRLVEEYGGNYWPPQIGFENKNLAVNPSFHGHKIGKECKMPFLWWGIRSPNLSKRNSSYSFVLETYLPYLLPHLQSVKRAQQKNKLWIKGVKTALNIATLGMSDTLSNAKTILDAGIDIMSTKGLSKQQDVFESIMAEQLSLRKKVTSLFRKLFSLEANSITIPIIIFLDDAQFSDTDENLMSTLSDLLEMAEEERYPLLLIINHWESHWNEQLSNSFKTSRGNDGISKLVHNFLSMKGGTDLAYNRVNESDYLISLGHLPEIANLLQDVNPSLPKDQQKQILKKTGGNPLLLEQIYLRYLTSAHNYTEERFELGLKDSIIRSISNKSFELHSLIEDRLLEDRLKDVKAVLAYAAQQGAMFSVDILKSTIANLAFYDVDGVISKAMSIEKLIEKNAQQFYEFVQPAVYEVVHKFAHELEIEKSYLPILQQWCVDLCLSDMKMKENYIPILKLHSILESIICGKPNFSNSEACSMINIYGMRCVGSFYTNNLHESSTMAERVIEYMNTLSVEWVKKIHPTILLASSDIRLYMGDIEGARKLNTYILTDEETYNETTGLYNPISVFDESLLQGIKIAQANNDIKTAKKLSDKIIARLQAHQNDVDHRFYCQTLLRTGDVFRYGNEPQKAREHFEQAVKLSVVINQDKKFQIMIDDMAILSLTALAKWYLDHDTAKSIEYFDYALAVGDTIKKNNPTINMLDVDELLVRVLCQKAVIMAKINNPVTALELIHSAIDLIHEVNKTHSTESTLMQVAICYEYESNILMMLDQVEDLKSSYRRYFMATKQLSEQTKSIIGFSLLDKFIHAQYDGPLKYDVGNLWQPAFALANEMLSNTNKKEYEINMIFNLFRDSTLNCHDLILANIIEPFSEFYLFAEECYRLIRLQSDTDPLNEFLLLLTVITAKSKKIAPEELLDRLAYGIKYTNSYLKIKKSNQVAYCRYVYYEMLGTHYKENNNVRMSKICFRKAYQQIKRVFDSSRTFSYLSDFCKASENYCAILCMDKNPELSYKLLEEVESAILDFEGYAARIDNYYVWQLWQHVGEMWNIYAHYFPGSSLVNGAYWTRLVNVLLYVEKKCNTIVYSDNLFVTLIDMATCYKREDQKEDALAAVRILDEELKRRFDKLHPMTIRYFGNIASQIKNELLSSKF